MRKSIRILCAIACGVFSFSVLADETIYQKGKLFSKKAVTIQAGGKLQFVNDDSVAHNVYANINGSKKDLGLQKPGETGEISFDAAGRYRVRCAIHPKMKLTVTVE